MNAPAWFAPAIRERLETFVALTLVAVACFAIGSALGWRTRGRYDLVNAPVIMLVPFGPTAPACLEDQEAISL